MIRKRRKRLRAARENMDAKVGGLWCLAWALERIPAARTVGQEISNLFGSFAETHPHATQAAAKCGTKDFAKELALVLRGHFGLEAVSQGQEG